MRVADAKRAAIRWVDEVASGLEGFEGAFLHGSINWMGDDDLFPATSDVDVGVVLAAGAPTPKLGKALCDGVIVEGAAIERSRVGSAEQLLADGKLGHSFRTPSVIADPTGHLARVQSQVSRAFAERRWVLARCESASVHAKRYARQLDADLPLHVHVICWLFAEGNLTHVLLAAGLRNPTVRRRYSEVRKLLVAYGRPDVHEVLLARLGCGAISPGRVREHLDRMTRAFDDAAGVIRSDFPFRSDLSAAARPVAVDGSRELIERGEHREAVFWIAVTYARCMDVLHTDASPSARVEHAPGFETLLLELGVPGPAEMRARARGLEAFLPELMQLAVELVDHNRDLDGGSPRG